jgi:hypothetical protein
MEASTQGARVAGPLLRGSIGKDMRFGCMRVAAACLTVAFLGVADDHAVAQTTRQTAFDRPASSDAGIDSKIDKYVEAGKTLGGPAPKPECPWLGKRVVSLLWRDDLDNAFRNLDLYDQSGCSAGHIQTAFRSVIRQGNIDLKAQGLLNGRIQSCWVNSNVDTITSPAASASAAAFAQVR